MKVILFSETWIFPDKKNWSGEVLYHIYTIFLKRGYLYESRKKSTAKKQNVLRAKEHETKKIKNKILSKGEKWWQRIKSCVILKKL